MILFRCCGEQVTGTFMLIFSLDIISKNISSERIAGCMGTSTRGCSFSICSLIAFFPMQLFSFAMIGLLFLKHHGIIVYPVQGAVNLAVTYYPQHCGMQTGKDCDSLAHFLPECFFSSLTMNCGFLKVDWTSLIRYSPIIPREIRIHPEKKVINRTMVVNPETVIFPLKYRTK